MRHTGDTVRGYGTFAVRQINTGIIVAEYLGRVVDSAMLDELYGRRTAPYAIRLARTSVYFDGMGEFSVGSMVNMAGDGDKPNAQCSTVCAEGGAAVHRLY